jgi:hypothetical protein
VRTASNPSPASFTSSSGVSTGTAGADSGAGGAAGAGAFAVSAAAGGFGAAGFDFCGGKTNCQMMRTATERTVAMRTRRFSGPKFYLSDSGTGSMPPGLKGWHLRRRRAARADPFSAPWRSRAVAA